jgi:heme-degrading monooxygenase HmoA
MYIAIRRMKVKSGLLGDAIQRIENRFVPLIRTMPGYVEYFVMQAGEEEGVTISVFERQEQAEESSRRAAEWVSQNLAAVVSGPSEIVSAGNIWFHIDT